MSKRHLSLRRWWVVLLVLTGPVFAAPIAPELASTIDRIFARWDKTDTPGAALAIARDGETIYARGYGMANLEHGIRMMPETISETGSVAKQFTAAAVVLLAERGQLSLNDSIKQHLPEMPEFGRRITLRMLLDHTSGLRDIHGLFDLLARPSYTSPHENAEVLEVVSRQRDLNFAPGTEYLYSNTGYILMTLLVERVSGQPFPEFCAENIFRPLGMMHTAWRSQFTRIVPGRAAAYAAEPGGRFHVDLPYSNIYGNGGLLTTVGDLLIWNRSFETAEGEWLKVVRALQVPSKLKDGRPIENALGLRIVKYRGYDEVSHSGATAGYSTFLARYPAQRLSIALLANCDIIDGGALVHRIADALLGLPTAATVKPLAMPLSEAELAAHTGLYRSVEHDLLIQIATTARGLSANRVPLIATAPHAFSSVSGAARYEFNEIREGRPSRMILTASRLVRPFARVEPASPTLEKLAEYAGVYRSPELDVVIPVTVTEVGLSVRLSPAPAQIAEPTFADGFMVGRAWHFTFTRNAAGAVDGFEATNASGRCRRIKFERR